MDTILTQRELIKDLKDELSSLIKRRTFFQASGDPETKSQVIEEFDENIERVEAEIKYQKGILRNLETVMQ